jgi:hypothetical protein
MMVLQDKTNAATGTFYDMINLLFVELDKLAGAFGCGGGEGGAAGMVKELTTLMGEGLVNVMSFVIWTVAQLVKGLGFLAYIIEGIAGGLGALYMQFEGAGGGLAGMRALEPGKAFAQGFAVADGQRKKRDTDAAMLSSKRDEKKKIEDQKTKDKEAAADIKPPPVINIKIEQRIETDSSPERIAYKTSELMFEIFNNGSLSVDRFT